MSQHLFVLVSSFHFWRHGQMIGRHTSKWSRLMLAMKNDVGGFHHWRWVIIQQTSQKTNVSTYLVTYSLTHSSSLNVHMGVSWNGGTPKWMVYKGQFQSKMDDLGVPPYFRKPPYIIAISLIFHSLIDGIHEAIICPMVRIPAIGPKKCGYGWFFCLHIIDHP